MNKLTYNHLDIDIYSEKLDNGLEIYVIPKDSVNNIYATFSTKFGAVNNEFTPIGEDEMIRVPDGVAHFLEHQVFNQKDGRDPLNFFTSNGASGNANTSYYKTTYLFTGTDKFEENLEYLLDFVQEPYFTDQSVNKEKGIIEQEINMYLDNPYNQSYELLNSNVFHNHPIKNNVIGSVKSIKSITKEDLYNCYNTFYHPSNMFVVVTGNVDPEATIKLIKDNQSKKTFAEPTEIELKKYDEPDEVKKEFETLEMNISLPKVLMGFKFNMHDFNLEEQVLRWYLSLLANIKFSTTSLFFENLKKDNITTEEIGYTLLCTDDHALFILDNETNYPDDFIDRVKDEIKKIDIDEQEFNRKKKSFLSSIIYMTDDIYSLNQNVMSNIVNDGFVRTDIYDEILKLNFKEFNDFISKLDFDNLATVVVKPKETSD